VAECEKKIVSLDTQVELKQASIRDEESRIESLKQTAKELEAELEAKAKEVEDVNGAYARMKSQHEIAQQKFNSNQELLQTLQTGLADSANTSGGGYLGQLADAKARIVQAETEEEQIRRQVMLVEKELAEMQAKWKKVEKEASDGAKSVERGKQELEKLKVNFSKMNWSEEKDANSAATLRKARDEVRALTEVCGFIFI
jgi:structural maintenance of chromosome 2